MDLQGCLGKVREQQEDSAQNKTKTLGLTQVWGDETLAEQEVATDSSEVATHSFLLSSQAKGWGRTLGGRPGCTWDGRYSSLPSALLRGVANLGPDVPQHTFTKDLPLQAETQSTEFC